MKVACVKIVNSRLGRCLAQLVNRAQRNGGGTADSPEQLSVQVKNGQGDEGATDANADACDQEFPAFALGPTRASGSQMIRNRFHVASNNRWPEC